MERSLIAASAKMKQRLWSCGPLTHALAFILEANIQTKGKCGF
jgi:hypothetical protein